MKNLFFVAGVLFCIWSVSLTWADGSYDIPLFERLTAIFPVSIILLFVVGYFCVSERNSRRFQRLFERKELEIVRLNSKFDNEVQANRQTEQALIKSEERYRALFDNNPIQTIVVDNSCRIVMYNFARTKVEGRLPVIGALMYRDYAQYHDNDMYSELVSCIKGGEQKEFAELKYREKYLRIHISPFTEGAIITSIDLTATKNLFDQLQQSHKMEAVGTLAGGIAHEFNNILGIIIGNVELVMDDISERSSIRESLLEIQSAGLRAKDVVRQLLSFSRQKNRVKKPVNIGEVVEDSINFIRASIPASIEIFSSIQKDIPLLMADSMQMQQVLVNLCTNSSHAMENDRGTIRIELQEILLQYDRPEEYNHISPGTYILLAVSDNGRGIASTIQEKVFDPYFTTKEVGEGTGMGLAIVHAIVMDHGGEIILKSEFDIGTTIQILLPTLNEKSSLS